MKNDKARYDYLFFAFAALELLALLLPAEVGVRLQYFAKPLLMPSLALYFYSQVPKPLSRPHNLMLLALLFSCLGDLFLLSAEQSFFIFGLGSFLFTHLIYIWLFRARFAIRTQLLNFTAAFAMLALYGYQLLSALLPKLPSDLSIPVLVYAFTILLMVVTAVGRKGNVSRRSHNLLLAGALSFLFSDSLIALNRFVNPIPYAAVWIMLLYMLGQWLIVKGYLEEGRG